jgi:pectinesterase inhibitor-like protein
MLAYKLVQLSSFKHNPYNTQEKTLAKNIIVMVNSFVKPFFLVLALFLCFVPSFCSDKIVQVNDICSKHKTPYNCAIILNSIPGVATDGANINSLSPYLINLAHVNAFDTKTLINTLIQNTTDPNLKQHFITCSMDYDDVLFSLTQAKDSFTSGNFIGMKSNSASVLEKVYDCDYKTPSTPLLKVNEDLEDVTIIITILADYLAGKYI